jgi:hypothetical protein
VKLQNPITLKRMWNEAAVQDQAADQAQAQIDWLITEIPAAEQAIADAEAQVRKLTAALLSLRKDLTEWRKRHADATTEGADLRELVKTACEAMGWELPVADEPDPPADNGGYVAARPDGRLVANGQRDTKATQTVPDGGE